MRVARSRAVVAGLFAVAWPLGGCASSAPPEVPPDPGASATSAPGRNPPVVLVDSAVVVDACPDASRMNAKAAQATIRKLVEPCSSVPGGKAHFSAILHRDGRIQLASPKGDPSRGVVPTCALEHKLVHQVTLSKPCELEVTLEERSLP